ncbi:hypothetical protein TIFTF001_034032 [Ficus carica]|uniref:Leucine-rich repeat-containing N-terminal plant-type domain-containing protein n=1 Tax=Ficus carica TaxID=3494 RepID=A0AA88E6I4_FICCA|nr:hypothetical protein TIFTF001_034032 [Ficus carica]
MMMVFLAWLGLLFFFLITSPFNSSSALTSSHFPSHLPLCHPHESSALLHFENSLSITNDTSYFSSCSYWYGINNPNSTVYWNMSRDCCTWSGVTCDEVSGHVVRLDLGCGGLHGIIHSNNSLFLLTHLQSLVLFFNYLVGSEISPQFGRFSSMIHLDLSDSGFTGQLPLEFSYLSSLVTLDLSYSDLRLETSSLKRIVANLTSLKELRLSRVHMFFASPNSFMNLSTSLTSLDLSDSGLTGEFPENIFHLPRLQNLDLSYNRNLNGSFPQYNWSSQLRNLNLSETGFLIDLPYLTKTLKSLNTLFLSSCKLRGLSPPLLGNLTQITSLDLSSTNVGGQIPWSFLNLEKLTHLDLAAEASIFGSSKDLEEDDVVEPALAQEGGEGQTSKQRKTESLDKFRREDA